MYGIYTVQGTEYIPKYSAFGCFAVREMYSTNVDPISMKEMHWFDR